MTRIRRPKNEVWEKVTAEELFDLSFRKSMIYSEIAEIYNVTPEQVSYKRNKFNLKYSCDSVGMRRLMTEHTIDAMAISCGISEEYKQKYKNLTTEYFKELMKN